MTLKLARQPLLELPLMKFPFTRTLNLFKCLYRIVEALPAESSYHNRLTEEPHLLSHSPVWYVESLHVQCAWVLMVSL